MGVGIQINVLDGAGPAMREVVGKLNDRTALHQSIGESVQQGIRDHLAEVSRTRHNTAMRLGAAPSGFWEKAVDNIGLNADGQRAEITIAHPGISRAEHDVTIVPGAGKKALTIPLVAEAYNQRAYRMPGLFVLKAKDGKAYLAKSEGGAVRLFYKLVPSVTLKQDRSLLPSDAEIRLAGRRGMEAYLDAEIAKRLN
ncbi:MAG: hypothetical protein WCO56_11455 [Verrucomicrobiota bacterium]